MTDRGQRRDILNRFRPRSGLFYGWRLVAIGAVFLAVSGAFGSQLVRELDVLSRGGWTFSFGWAGYILAIQAWNGFNIVAGFGVDRFGPRRMMQVGLIIAGLGLLLYISVQLAPIMLFAAAVMGLGSKIGSSIAIYGALNNWFRRRKATAMALAMFGANLIGNPIGLVIGLVRDIPRLAIVPMLAGLSVLALAQAAPKLIRNRPEDVGQSPDGETLVGEAGQSELTTAQGLPEAPEFTRPEFSLGEAMKSRAFWYITAGNGLTTMAGVVPSVAVFVSSTPGGVSRISLVNPFPLVTLVSAVSIITGGMIGDRIPIRFAVAGFALLQIPGIFLFVVGENAVLLYAALAVGAVASSGGQAPSVAIYGVYFGRRNFATLASLAGVVGSVITGVMVRVMLYGNLPDGVINALVIATGVASAVGAALVLRAGPPRPSPSQRAAAGGQ